MAVLLWNIYTKSRCFVEKIHERLRAELKRLDRSAAQASKAAGEANSQGLRDVLSGRKRLTADLLGALVLAVGVDGHYVLTGHQEPRTPPINADEQELLALFRAAPLAVKAAAIGALQGAAAGVTLLQKGAGVQIGLAHGPVTVGAPSRRKGA